MTVNSDQQAVLLFRLSGITCIITGTWTAFGGGAALLAAGVLLFVMGSERL